MEIFALMVLGFLQGLTEFLPISSSGHLVLFGNIFNIKETFFVSIILHVATLLSVCIVFRKDIWYMIKHPLSNQTLTLVVATIPTCLIALVFLPVINEAFEGKFLCISFLISAFLLFFAERRKEKYPYSNKSIDFKTAIWMGIVQGIAIFPGISRSGSTISAGLYAKADKNQCAKFSFLMSLPIILFSLFMEIFEISNSNIQLNVSYIGIILSFLIAFIVGIFSIKLMIKLTSNSNLKYFSLYLILIAVLSLFLL